MTYNVFCGTLNPTPSINQPTKILIDLASYRAMTHTNDAQTCIPATARLDP